MEDNLNIQNEELNENSCCSNNSENKKCNCKCSQTALNIVLSVAVIVLFILHFSGSGSQSGQSGKTAVNPTESITVGFVDTDSLIDQYEYAIELNSKMKRYANMEANYKAQATKLQEDYNNYLKTGANMTLTDQKKNEESLKKRASDLEYLESQLVAEQQKLESVINVDQKKMIEAVYAFIRDYNAKNQNFTIILKKSFSESPVLYIDSTLNITREIIDGLNEEYREYKKSGK